MKIRDNFTCQNCGATPNDRKLIDAHHILPKADYPHWQTEVENGVALCKNCHKLADAGLVGTEKFLNNLQLTP